MPAVILNEDMLVILVTGEVEGVTCSGMRRNPFFHGISRAVCFPAPGKLLHLQLTSFDGCGGEQTFRRGIPETVLGDAAFFFFFGCCSFRKHLDFLISAECVMGWNLHRPVPASFLPALPV